MKITKTQLRNIIKEEATQALSEVVYETLVEHSALSPDGSP